MQPLQCPCLEHPMDRGAWHATVHGVTKNQTWLKQLSAHARNKKERQEKGNVYFMSYIYEQVALLGI